MTVDRLSWLVNMAVSTYDVECGLPYVNPETDEAFFDAATALLLKEPWTDGAVLHEMWGVHRTKHGWTYGVMPDPEVKTDPRLLHWHDLGDDVRRRYDLMLAIVETVAEPAGDDDDTHAALGEREQAPAAPGHVNE